LTIALLLFSERFVATVIEPSIADLRFEVDAAGSDRVRRRRAVWRGYAAFWRVTLAAPFDAWSSMRRVTSGAIAVTLLAIPVLGGWIVGVAGAAALVAVLIHWWYDRHPSIVAAPGEGPWRSPQINFSSTEVAGNVGGLIFVVGTIVIVCLGVPPVVLFLLAVSVAASVVAWGLVAWHTRHPEGEGLLSMKVKS
jgi:hypothetical protein